MKSHYSAHELHLILKISERAIRKRALKEGWDFIEIPNTEGGGMVKCFAYASFPEDIRKAICAQASESSSAEDEELKDLAIHPEAAQIWANLPDKEKSIALARLEVMRSADRYVVRGVLKSREKVKQLEEFYDRLAEGIKEADTGVLKRLGLVDEKIPDIMVLVRRVGVKTHYKWEKSYEEAKRTLGVGVIGLVRTQRESPGFGARCISPDIIAYAKDLIEQGDVKLKKISRCEDGRVVEVNRALLFRRLENKFGKDSLPHYAHFTRWANGWLSKEQEPLTAVCMPSFWRSTFAPDAGRGTMSTDVWYAGQRWEWDGTRADVMLKNGRHEIIVSEDIFSRDVVVEIERNASAITVAKLMKTGLTRWGKPEVITSDNGSIFIANHIQAACKSLEIDLQRCKGYAPNEKPHIESFMNVLTRMLFEAMTWFVGHNPQERKRIEEYHHFSQVFYHKRGEKLSCEATGEELRKVVNDWLEKVYRPGLHDFADCCKGRSRSILERLSSSPRRAPRISKPEELEWLLSPTFERVFESGVKWENGHYHPNDIASWERAQKYQKQNVLFRPLLSDIGRGAIWQLTPEGKVGELICYVANQDRGGLSLEDYSKAKKIIEKKHKERRKAVEAMAGPQTYEAELAEMPEPKVYVANFGAVEFAGRQYRDLVDYDPRRMPQKPAGGWLSEEARLQVERELREMEARVETPPDIETGRESSATPPPLSINAKVVELRTQQESPRDTGKADQGKDWKKLWDLSEDERYERIMECEVLGMQVPADLKSSARYFEQTPLYQKLRSYYEDKRAMFVMMNSLKA